MNPTIQTRPIVVWDTGCRRAYRRFLREHFARVRIATADGAASNTDERVERFIEREFDRLDSAFMHSTMTQAEYDRHGARLSALARALYGEAAQ